MSYIRLDNDLTTFFSSTEINLYDGDNVINLLDLFPTIKQGLFAINVPYLILRMYAQHNGLCTNMGVIVDEAIGKYFNKQVGSIINIYDLILTYTILPTCDERIKDIRKDTHGISRFQILSFVKDNILGINLFSVARDSPNILDVLFRHPKINKLHLSIVFDDIEQIKKLLLVVDPRCHNFRSYILALERANNNIITLVKDNIILRTLLHKKILSIYIPEVAADIYYLMLQMF